MQFKHEECKWFYKVKGICKCGLNPTVVILDDEQPLCISLTLRKEIWEARDELNKM